MLTSREDNIIIKIYATYQELGENSVEKPFLIFEGEKLAYTERYWKHPVQRAQNNSIISEVRLMSKGYKILNLNIQDNIKDSITTKNLFKRLEEKYEIFFNNKFTEPFWNSLKTYKKGKTSSGKLAEVLRSLQTIDEQKFSYFHYNEGIALIKRYKTEEEISADFLSNEGIILDYSLGDIIGNPQEMRKRKKYNKDLGIAEYGKSSMIVNVPLSRFNDFLFPGRPVKVIYNDTISYYNLYRKKYNISNRENDFFHIEMELRIDFAEDIFIDS
jgi:hypothetical protein